MFEKIVLKQLRKVINKPVKFLKLRWTSKYWRAKEWQNMFAITRFCYVQVLFDVFHHYWVKKIFRYTEDFVI